MRKRIATCQPALCVSKAVVIGLAAVLAPHLAVAAVDLTPRFIDTFVEGTTFHRLYFTDGGRKIVLSLNREIEAAADSGGTLFRFSRLPETTFLVIRSRHSPDDRFEAAALDRYRESARRLLPGRSSHSAIREEVLIPFPINNWRGYRFVLSFDIGIDHQFQSVTFLNLNDADQIVLITTAPEKAFAEAMQRSHQLIRTWQPMLPSDEKPAKGN